MTSLLDYSSDSDQSVSVEGAANRTENDKSSKRIKELLELRRQGKRLNENLAQSRAFHNPTVYSSLVKFSRLSEHGSNIGWMKSRDKDLEANIYPEAIGNSPLPQISLNKWSTAERQRQEPQPLVGRKQVEFTTPTTSHNSSSTYKAREEGKKKRRFFY